MSVPAQVPSAQAPGPVPPPVVPVPILTTPTVEVPACPTVVPCPILSAPMAAAVPVPSLHSPAGPTAPSATPFLALLPVSLDFAPAHVILMEATSQSLRVDAFKLLQLNPIKDAKSYRAMYEVIQLYLYMHVFSTGHADGAYD